QAEDGIRDFHVTGVQTCALPIYRRVDEHHLEASLVLAGDFQVVDAVEDGRVQVAQQLQSTWVVGAKLACQAHWDISRLNCANLRSEERRVGNEGRYECCHAAQGV